MAPLEFPKYSEVPYISKGAEIVVVWKTKSYVEELICSQKKGVRFWDPLLKGLKILGHHDKRVNIFYTLYKRK